MPPTLPLPRGWKRRVRSSVLHILALGHHHLLEQRTFSRRTWTGTPVITPRDRSAPKTDVRGSRRRIDASSSSAPLPYLPSGSIPRREKI